MFYHESVPALLRVMKGCGETIDVQTAIVRDSSGKVSIARKQFNDPRELESRLKAELGSYAGALPVIEGAFAESLLVKKNAKVISCKQDNTEEAFVYVDNRIVGEDWLSKAAASDTSAASQRITFYSLKGGVGRSTALAIYAIHLSSLGKKVLAIDLDIEAPGLGSILLPSDRRRISGALPEYGVIDYLLENGISKIDDATLYDFIGTSPFGGGAIDVLPAIGRATEKHPSLYMEKLSRALTEDHINGERETLSMQVQELVKKFENLKQYDVVLLDARAGFSEITAATLMGLKSHLVFFGVDQSQIFTGYRYLLNHLAAQTNFEDPKNSVWRENITFVQSKAPATRREREHYKNELFDICAETIYDQVESDEELSSDLFTFAPTDNSPSAPHNATFIRFDVAFSHFEPVTHEEQLEAELYSGAYGSFIKRLDEVTDVPGEDK